MERIEDILSRQYCHIEFKDGKVYYFSISTRHDKADTLEEAITDIIEADKKFEGMTGLSYVVKKLEESLSIPKLNNKSYVDEQPTVYDEKELEQFEFDRRKHLCECVTKEEYDKYIKGKI